MTNKLRILRAYHQKNWNLIKQLSQNEEIKYPKLPDLKILAIILEALYKK